MSDWTLLEIISRVSVTCFAAGYLIALVLEVSRLFFRAPIRLVVMLGFTAAGLLAHTLYLVSLARVEVIRQEAGGVPLSSWYDWCLLVAWLLAATYLGLTFRRPQTAVGLFMLPLILGLIGVATLFRDVPPFPRSQAVFIWGTIHGLALLLGTVAVMLGFVAGVMYLVQSYRLKHKLPPRQGFKLPTLEWLQGANKLALVYSALLVAAGLVAGIIMNLIHGGVPWTDPVVITSGILLLWLLAAALFEYYYKPARQGRKVAYLTVASFIFLGLVLSMVLFGPSEHASPKQRDRSAELQVGSVPGMVRMAAAGPRCVEVGSTSERTSLACASGLLIDIRAGAMAISVGDRQ